jgi:hypothetical protein
MGATVTVSLGIVRERDSGKNKPTRTEDASQTDMADTSMREDLANLAYALWQCRGCPHGSPEVDWTEAERKLHQSSEHVSR